MEVTGSSWGYTYPWLWETAPIHNLPLHLELDATPSPAVASVGWRPRDGGFPRPHANSPARDEGSLQGDPLSRKNRRAYWP